MNFKRLLWGSLGTVFLVCGVAVLMMAKGEPFAVIAGFLSGVFGFGALVVVKDPSFWQSGKPKRKKR